MENWNESILAALEAYARITTRGQKWQQRRIPIYIRENLMVPYYIAIEGNRALLYAIKYPEQEGEKVCFENVGRSSINETSSVFTFTKQAGQVA